MTAPVTQQVALQVIRTWAAFERDHPEMHVLVPEHVLKICDEALGIDRARGEGGAVVKAMTDRYESRASTHADDCWSWGPGHYTCAVRKIERLRTENARLREDAARYAIARRMSPQQWADAWELNHRTGKPFDEIIDDLAPFFDAAVAGRGKDERD